MFTGHTTQQKQNVNFSKCMWKKNSTKWRWRHIKFIKLNKVVFREEFTPTCWSKSRFSVVGIENNMINIPATVAQWIECQPMRVTSSIPSLQHRPGLLGRSPVGGAQEAITHWCLSSSLSPSLLLSKNKF